MTKSLLVASSLLVAGCASPLTLAYGSVTAACIDAERSIVAREPTTLENDQRDMRSVRSVCDAILAHLRGQEQ